MSQRLRQPPRDGISISLRSSDGRETRWVAEQAGPGGGNGNPVDSGETSRRARRLARSILRLARVAVVSRDVACAGGEGRVDSDIAPA